MLSEAGEALLERFDGPSHDLSTVRRKRDGSPMTEADQAAERILAAALAAAFPADGIVGEETGRRAQGARTWVVDPLDGTASFTEGLAHWCATVARLDERPDGTLLPAVGAIWLPRLREYYFVESGLGAFRNGRPLPPLERPRLARYEVLFVPSRLHARARLDWRGKARSLGSIAAHLALVSAGAAVAALVPAGWHAWDGAAGLALIEAVGGRAALTDGSPLTLPLHEGRPFVAGAPAAVEYLLEPGRIRFVSSGDLERPSNRGRHA